MSLIATRVSVDAYLAGEWPPNSQLIEGEVVVNDPAIRHQRAVTAIVGELRNWARAEKGRGEASQGGNWIVGAGANVYKPDVWWVSDAHRPGRDAIWVDAVPDLAVEVRSPGTWRYDVGAKMRVYEAAGLPELWLVDTLAETVLAYWRSSATASSFDVSFEFGPDETVTSPQLPGFELLVAVIFES